MFWVNMILIGFFVYLTTLFHSMSTLKEECEHWTGEGMYEELVMAYYRYYHSIYQERLKTTTKSQWG